MTLPLEVQGLSTTLFTRRGEMKAVDGLSLSVSAGETVALVGESGCGKSLSALSIMRLLPDPPARIVGGTVSLNGRDIVAASEETMLDIRGKEIGMIFQDPISSLNPVTTIEKQIAEVLTTHTELGRGQARARAHELLELVGMPDAGRRLDAYPHQLSGGMCQRVVIALAIACSPSNISSCTNVAATNMTSRGTSVDRLNCALRAPTAKPISVFVMPPIPTIPPPKRTHATSGWVRTFATRLCNIRRTSRPVAGPPPCMASVSGAAHTAANGTTMPSRRCWTMWMVRRSSS